MRVSSQGRNWARTLGGGLFLTLGLVCVALLLYSLGRDLSLWVLSRETTAEVTELWVEQIGDRQEGELNFHYFARYRFITPSGTVIVDSTRLDVRSWGALREGGPIEVVYFPPYPAYNRLEESRFVPILACAYVPFFIVAWAALGVGWYLVRPEASRPSWFAPGEAADGSARSRT